MQVQVKYLCHAAGHKGITGVLEEVRLAGTRQGTEEASDTAHYFSPYLWGMVSGASFSLNHANHQLA